MCHNIYPTSGSDSHPCICYTMSLGLGVDLSPNYEWSPNVHLFSAFYPVVSVCSSLLITRNILTNTHSSTDMGINIIIIKNAFWREYRVHLAKQWQQFVCYGLWTSLHKLLTKLRYQVQLPIGQQLIRRRPLMSLTKLGTTVPVDFSHHATCFKYLFELILVFTHLE